MKEVIELSWLVIAAVLLVGIILTSVGLKLRQERFSEKKDALGVRYSERSLFLLLNGMFLVLGGTLATVLKIFMTQ